MNIAYICGMSKKEKIEFINNGVVSDVDRIMEDKTVKRVAIVIEREDVPDKKVYRKPNFAEFFFCFSEFSYQIMKAKLKGETMRLLWLMLSTMSYKNEVAIDFNFWYQELNVGSRNTIYAGIKELLDKGIIFKSKLEGGKDCYKINADGFWKGTIKERKDFLKDNGNMPKLLIAPKDA